MTLVSNQLQEICNNADVEFNNLYKKCTKVAEAKENTLENPEKHLIGSITQMLNQTLQKNIGIVRFLFHSLILLLNNSMKELGNSKSYMNLMYLVSDFQDKLSSFENDLLEYFNDDLTSKTTFRQEIQLWHQN